MKNIIPIVLLFSLIAFNSYCQTELGLFPQLGVGTQTDIPNRETVAGASIGLGLDFKNQGNRWQAVLNISKFSNQKLSDLTYHGFKSWTASLQFGRQWETNFSIANNNILVGAGGMVISSLRPNIAPGRDNTVSYPALGLYGRILYPIGSQNSPFLVFYEPSIFGEGFMRNLLGIAYKLNP